MHDPVHFPDWPAAVDALLRLGERRVEPTVVVLDEFPFLLDVELIDLERLYRGQ